MLLTPEEEVRHQFKPYRFFLIREFVVSLLPPPLAEYEFFTITTADNVSMKVWGKSAKELIEQFQKFARLEFYL